MEKTIIAKYGKLTPPRILRYFIEDTLFKTEHEKRPYTFIVIGKVGHTGKTWTTIGLRKYGFNALELSESIYNLVDYRDRKNHVIEDEFERTITIILNETLEDKQ